MQAVEPEIGRRAEGETIDPDPDFCAAMAEQPRMERKVRGEAHRVEGQARDPLRSDAARLQEQVRRQIGAGEQGACQAHAQGVRGMADLQPRHAVEPARVDLPRADAGDGDLESVPRGVPLESRCGAHQGTD